MNFLSAGMFIAKSLGSIDEDNLMNNSLLLRKEGKAIPVLTSTIG